MVKYIEVDGQTLRVKVDYDLGGYDYFQQVEVERGYYLSVTPIERNVTSSGAVFETTRVDSSVRELLLSVTRRSKKKEEKALTLAEEREEELIKYILESRTF